MKTLKASIIINESKGEFYYELRHSKRWIKEQDVRGSDWKDSEGMVESTFAVARAGTGALICLDCDDDSVWLTTDDKINSGPFAAAR